MHFLINTNCSVQAFWRRPVKVNLVNNMLILVYRNIETYVGMKFNVPQTQIMKIFVVTKNLGGIYSKVCYNVSIKMVSNEPVYFYNIQFHLNVVNNFASVQLFLKIKFQSYFIRKICFYLNITRKLCNFGKLILSIQNYIFYNL